jgi:glycosyltransferase involved in cell wall biosynthesis
MKKIFIVVATDEVLLSHRLPVAIEALKNGYDVTVVATDTGRSREIIEKGIKFINQKIERRRLSILNEVRIIKTLYKLYKSEKPFIVHSVTMKIVVNSTIAAKLAGIHNRVNAIAGLGIFFEKNWKSNIMRFFLNFVFRFVKSNKQIWIFQNEFDKKVFVKRQWANSDKCVLIKGAGINLEKYKHVPEPLNNEINVLFATRIVKHKGVFDLIESIKYIREKGINNIVFTFVGSPTIDVGEHQLREWENKGYIKYKGFVEDTSEEIIKSNICILPSYSEGLPKSLIEACAIGRAIITTDVPGCRDVVTNNINGILVQPRNIEHLTNAIVFLSNNNELRMKFGFINRLKAESEFDIKDVVKKTVDVYKIYNNF